MRIGEKNEINFLSETIEKNEHVYRVTPVGLNMQAPRYLIKQTNLNSHA